MRPLQPAHAPPVRGVAGIGHEVGAGHQHPRVQLAVGVEHHDLVDDVGRSAARGVVLAHHQHPPPLDVDDAVGPAVAAGHLWLGRDRHRHRLADQAMEPLVVPVGEPHRAARHPPCAAAVLVHGRACVEPRGQQVDGRAVAPALHELGAPTLLGTLLGPGDRVAVQRHASQAGGGSHHQLGGDRGRPRTVRRHGPEGSDGAGRLARRLMGGGPEAPGHLGQRKGGLPWFAATRDRP